jgi:hypothetical protein
MTISVVISSRAYPKLIYYNKLGKGGHWEQPELFVGELRVAFKSLPWAAFDHRSRQRSKGSGACLYHCICLG